jgi:hypothetical protein
VFLYGTPSDEVCQIIILLVSLLCLLSVQSAMVQALQKQSRIFNQLRWGEGPARVLLETSEGEIEIETAPFDLMPHTINYFLTMVS